MLDDFRIVAYDSQDGRLVQSWGVSGLLATGETHQLGSALLVAKKGGVI